MNRADMRMTIQILRVTCVAGSTSSVAPKALDFISARSLKSDIRNMGVDAPAGIRIGLAGDRLALFTDDDFPCRLMTCFTSELTSVK